MNYNERIEEYVNDEKTRRIFGEWAEYIAEQKGIKQGIKETKANIARAMLEDGIDIATIQKCTNLSQNQIKNL